MVAVCRNVGSIGRLQYKCSGTHICNEVGIFVQGHMPIIWNVYASSHGHIFHCTELISGRYTVIVISYLHMK